MRIKINWREQYRKEAAAHSETKAQQGSLEQMSEMVERVSEALRARFPEGSSGTMPASEDGSHDFGLYGDWARAAIGAMRQPTVEMVEQASHLVEGDTAVQYTRNTYQVWRIMIDEALK